MAEKSSSIQEDDHESEPRIPTIVKQAGIFTGLTRAGTFNSHLQRVGTTVIHHAKNHIGTGIICSVAYFDP